MKALYYQVSDNCEMSNITEQTLQGCMALIEADMEGANEGDDREYTIVPVWMTEEEFNNLPEAEF